MIAQDAFVARKRREYFLEASRPFYIQMARIRMTYTKYRMVVDPAGRLIRDESTLPDFAQEWITQLEAAVDQCRQLAERQEFL